MIEPGPAGTEPEMLAEVMSGLSRDPKEIPPKFFYDERGSRLFEEITRLPEYYPTRVERALLESCGPEWIRSLRPAALVEFGAGSARKSRILLDSMTTEGCGQLFVPIDVSAEFLTKTASALRVEYPGWAVAPEVADITEPLDLPGGLPRPALFALLGGTIGNFDSNGARRLLGRIVGSMRPDDHFLLGIDLRPSAAKPVGVLEAAYNDSRGVTAAFNLNVLNVLNARLGSDFDPARFEHRAFYNAEEARIEMHLQSLADQRIEIPGGGVVPLERGERIRTEISCKYDRAGLEETLEASGLRLKAWCGDPDRRFALVLARTCT